MYDINHWIPAFAGLPRAGRAATGIPPSRRIQDFRSINDGGVLLNHQIKRRYLHRPEANRPRPESGRNVIPAQAGIQWSVQYILVRENDNRKNDNLLVILVITD